MAKVVRKLPWVTSNRPGVDISFNETDRAEFETALGRELTADHIEELRFICSNYIDSRQAEFDAQPMAALRKHLNPAIKKMEGFWEVANGFPMDDAGQQLQSTLDRRLRNKFVPIDSSAVFECDTPKIESGNMVEWQRQDNLEAAYPKGGSKRLGIRMNMNFLLAVAMETAAALDETKREIKELEDSGRMGISDGWAFETLILGLRKWAKEKNLPYGPPEDGEPKKFARFVFQLHEKLPKEWRARLNSEVAADRRIRRIVGPAQ